MLFDEANNPDITIQERKDYRSTLLNILYQIYADPGFRYTDETTKQIIATCGVVTQNPDEVIFSFFIFT